jgi:NAD(P)-dependent dehydrogenase (short-subunit alcohol dehydrogenase family)
MPDRAAIVTGASRGIGRAIADTLGELGYGLTLSARKPESLEQAAAELRDRGYAVEAVVGSLADEDAIKQVVAAHRDRFGRLDVLVNSAGIGVGAAAGEHQTKFIDMQLDVNIRAIILFYREALEMLKAAGAEHQSAFVINLSSLAAKAPSPWLSVYSATKAAVVAYTTAMNKELANDGIRSVAFCPGFVDTDMSDFVKGMVPAEEMIRTDDIAAAVRFILGLSPWALIPEIVFQRPGEQP